MNKETTEEKANRKAGVLMPVSSLPSPFGIGTLGEGAYAFVDWLFDAGIKVWQVLPLLPTSYGDSPYQSCASDALNYYFIDFALLEEEGLLEKAEYESVDWNADERRVDYGKQFALKTEILKKAFSRLDKTDADWLAFLREGRYRDFALFMTLKRKFSYRSWLEWDEPYKNADKKALQTFARKNAEEIGFWQFTQYIFLKQWNALKDYAHAKGVEIMGDMPIYVSADSVESWKYRKDLFMLDEEGNISLRAGVPPDAFSEEGQLWGNPVYDWDKMKQNGYRWWKERIDYAFTLFDILRIDHFRGFDRFFVVEKGEETAKNGKWLDGPGAELFEGLEKYPIVAEDLGMIDESVRALMRKTGYPGMKVLLFSFDGNPTSEHKPSTYQENIVAYTGTHDNDTLKGYIESLDETARIAFEREFEEECLKLETPYITETLDDECQSAVELVFASKANLVIVPMHDILCFGNEARLNAPSTLSANNWSFRFTVKDLKRRKAAWLKELVEKYNR
ncbi:MAG: 4-alpha-glucanotransferase [Clostridia bacterium]|nr:4-alpha-glucanotransferase [Clostridia bacterium]